jgi:hypothetical protein
MNLAEGQDGEMWSWGKIERKIDRLMVERTRIYMTPITLS